MYFIASLRISQSNIRKNALLLGKMRIRLTLAITWMSFNKRYFFEKSCIITEIVVV